MKSFKAVLTSLALIAATASTARAGVVGLDRNSSDLVFGSGVKIDYGESTGGTFKTADRWPVAQEFQISLLGEKEEDGTPPNAEWEFNHYSPSNTSWEWSKGNFADFSYYYLEMDSGGNIDASFYFQGATGETLDWALYYADSTGRTQTVLGGTMEDTSVTDLGDDQGIFSTFLRITPTSTYRTFDGKNTEGFVNTVEIWGGEGKLTDLVGYQISALGTLGSWTAAEAVSAERKLVPEPSTLGIWGVLIALGLTAAWWRGRRSAVGSGFGRTPDSSVRKRWAAAE